MCKGTSNCKSHTKGTGCGGSVKYQVLYGCWGGWPQKSLPQHRTIPHLILSHPLSATPSSQPLQCMVFLEMAYIHWRNVTIHLDKSFDPNVWKMGEKFVNECDNCDTWVISAKNIVHLFLPARTCLCSCPTPDPHHHNHNHISSSSFRAKQIKV